MFTTLGTTKLDMEANIGKFSTTPGLTRLAELRFKEKFSWSVGARATLWECECFGFGIEEQYAQANPKIS